MTPERSPAGPRNALSVLARLPLLVMLPTAGGVGLVIYIVAGISLPLAFGILVVVGGSAWAVLLRRAPSSTRARLRRRATWGIGAGLLATLAYDLARFGWITLFAFSLDPFRVWTLFGQALLGTDAPAPLIFAVGTAYHLFNGMGFGLAFALVVPRPTWLLGVLWGLVLELMQALLYPAWLRLTALQEFLTVSVFGHVVYGATLGILLAAVTRRETAPPASPP